MASSRVTVDQPLLVCPACKKPISGRMTYKIDLLQTGEDQPIGEMPALATAVGLQVSHDCTTQVARGDTTVVGPGVGRGGPRILRPEE